VIAGEPASKANSRRLVRIKGRMVPIKSKKAISYSQGFNQQCPILDSIYKEDIAIAIKIFYRSRRPDLDESLILDLLQDKIYINDRCVKMKYVEHGLSKDNPRSLIVLGPLGKYDKVLNTFRELVDKENSGGQV
tara:strand:- start:765 stop:1166 length:402 start_codon:yes stop_codon:yes gene_type:complete